VRPEARLKDPTCWLANRLAALARHTSAQRGAKVCAKGSAEARTFEEPSAIDLSQAEIEGPKASRGVCFTP
jgi:hypothetical protein